MCVCVCAGCNRLLTPGVFPVGGGTGEERLAAHLLESVSECVTI